MRWSRYPRNDIYRILAAGFKQQRHVDDHKRPEAVLAEKVLASLCNRRMNERFQFFQRLTIAEHFFAKRLAIDAVGTGISRKRMFDRRDQCTAARLQPVHLGIGIAHRKAETAEHVSHRRFAPVDGSGKPDYDHAINLRSAEHTYERQSLM